MLIIWIGFMVQLVMGKSNESYVLSSPHITNWGDWGSWEYCSAGSYVAGMSLKVEQDQRGKDDTALNGVELHCRKRGSAEVVSKISSLTGPWGNWGKTFECPADFVAIGFRLRSEEQRGSEDDTAANNVGIICCDHDRDEVDYIQGDGTEWGAWTEIRVCPEGSAICGVQTQVEEDQHGGDDTSLNNINVKCCPF